MRRTTSTPRTSGLPSNGSRTRSDGPRLTGLAGPRVLDGAPDERLVELARAGDERAFRAIVERYRAPLLRYCLGFLPPEAAEDALQQTFINAYAALARDDGRAPVALKPWLYRVAHNAALNVARDPQAALAELPEDLDGVERPDEVAQRRERFSRVVGAVRALPVKQRQVIVRHALDGDSHDRIAADLGMSPGAIRQLAHRARRTVREAAAGLLPVPVLRWLPFGSSLAESGPAVGGGAAAVKVAVTIAVVAAGGGAVEATRHEHAPARQRAAKVVAATPATRATVPAATPVPRRVSEPVAPLRERSTSSGSGSRRESGDGGSSGSRSSGSGSSGTSGSGTSGSDSSGSGSSGSGSSGSSSSGSGSSGSGSSGSGSPGSDSSGSGTSGSGSSGSGTSGSGSSGSGSSGSGSSGSGSSGEGSPDDAVIAPAATPVATVEPDSSGPGSGGSDDHSGPG